MLRHRGLWLACLSVLLVPATASALTNWTRTVWEDGEVSFEFQSDDWEISGDANPDTPEIDPKVFVNSIGTESSVVGQLFEFTIPNFFDPLPLKIVDIVITGLNSGATSLFDQAGVLDIIGADADFDEGGPAQPVFFTPSADRVVQFGPNGVIVREQWSGMPNPDFEIVKLFAPTTFELHRIEITTQSVPEPSALALLGAGIAGLAVMGRRRMA
jgi:hypothetical protein